MRTLFFISTLLVLGTLARAEGRQGTITFSDGRTLNGALSLTPGKSLRIYTNDTTNVSLALDEVKEMRFKVEKEEMRDGFYFPTPGQATQAKTGDTYPVRYLSVQITLADGKSVAGHLMTTMLYVDTGDQVQKIPLLAKMTGENKQKIDDLVYPQDVRFDSGAVVADATQIDLTKAGFTPSKPPVILTKPELTLLPATQVEGKQVWTVATEHPENVILAVEAADGIHVAWPKIDAPDDVQKAVQDGLANMHDFYNEHTVLGCVIEDDQVYALVMLTRHGAMVDQGGTPITNGMIPWDLVALHFDYDAQAKKVTLLNRTTLVVGRAYNNSPAPAVLKQEELLRDMTKATP